MHDIQQYLGIAFIFMVTLCFFLAWYFWQRARHRELMLMIEKGMDPDEHRINAAKVLRNAALMLIAFALGSFTISLIEILNLRQLISGGGFFGVYAIFFSIALLIITRSDKKEKND